MERWKAQSKQDRSITEAPYYVGVGNAHLKEPSIRRFTHLQCYLAIASAVNMGICGPSFETRIIVSS